MTPAGKIVQFVKEYSSLALIILIIIIIYVLIMNGFPRFNWFSHSENMDVFLGENEFLESNLKGLMAFTSIPKSVATLFGIDTASLLTTITKLKTAIQDDFSGDYQKAIVHYYTFYDMVKNKESPTYVPYKQHEF